MNVKKLLLTNLPYLLFVYPFDKVSQAFRLAPGANLSAKLLSIGDGFTAAFSGMGLCNGPEGPDKSKKQGAVWADQAAACVFWNGGAHWSTAFLSAPKDGQFQHRHGLHDRGHAAPVPARHV